MPGIAGTQACEVSHDAKRWVVVFSEERKRRDDRRREELFVRAED